MYLHLSLCNSLCLCLCLSLCPSFSLSLSLTHKEREGDVQKLSTSSYCKYPRMIVNCVYVWCGNCVYFGRISLSSLFQCSTIIKQYLSIVCVCVSGCILCFYCLFHCVHHVYALGYYYDSTKYQQFVDYLCAYMCVF